LKRDRLFASREEELLKQDKKAYYIYSAVECGKKRVNPDESLYNKELSCYKVLQRGAKSSVRRRPEFTIDKAPFAYRALKSLDLELERSVLSEHEVHPKDFI